ncbi:hypothetical protein ACJMK2_004406 [Sinanodonta woodiana]|uniref:Uncharacterized protein n=1 Tax=Sinanodonta woodiana TaxID=1069815 RepID=A0ABD3Y117_SINWO
MGNRTYDLSSTAPDRTKCSSFSNSRVAILVAVVLLAGVIVAGIVLAVYFTSRPASQEQSVAMTRVEVSKVKTFQGEVRIELDWNENLNDLNSNFSKEKAYNFTSAMDAVYTNHPEYNGTVVDDFRNGSIIVTYRIFWVVKVIREIGKQEQIISEVETNPVDTANLVQLIKNNLPQRIGANVTQISELQEVTTTTAAPATTTIPAFTNGTSTTETPAANNTTTSLTLHPPKSTTLNYTTTTIHTNESTIITTATPTTIKLTTTNTTTKETTITTTTVSTTLPPIVATTLTTTPTTNITTTTSTTPDTTFTTRSSSTLPEYATTTTTTIKEPTTTTTTKQLTLQPTIATTTTTPMPSTVTITTATTSKPTITTEITSTITKEPTIITTAASTSHQPTSSTIVTATTQKPITSTTETTFTPRPTITSETTSTTPEIKTISNVPYTSLTTATSTFQSRTTSTTNTPEPNNITTTSITRNSAITLITSTTITAATLTMPANTNTTTTPQPTSTMNVPTTTPNPCKLSAETLACQFEDRCLCGYKNLRNDSRWFQRYGYFFMVPQYDHTFGNETGHFMAAYNNSDMFGYYNELNKNGLGYPHRLEYSNSTLISPRENFTTESCVYFYYYLNGTAVRPNPLSAQLYVYVSSIRGRELAWYDNINRTVSGWMKGWVNVNPGLAEVIFVAKTVTTTTVWPGVVALDDVSVISRPCPAYPDCGRDTFRCTTSRVCIPVYMQCDGGNDCVDGSDEENCTSKPDYVVKLINGDGSYGSIAIFYQGLWRPVCMSKYSLMKGNSTIVQLACKSNGYNGRYQGAFVNSWQNPVQYAMQISCSSYDVDISNCSMNLTQTRENTTSCYYYQAAICSTEDCFSGESLCPPYYNYSSSTKCISYRYFCDGIIDCPGATDELNCANCSTTEFECSDHECIPVSQRCDGTPQCADHSEEYGCVIGANNMPKIYHSHLSAYLPVCYNNMNDTLANTLCSLSGQGSSGHYQPYTYVQEGTLLIPQLNVTMPSLVPSYTVSVESCNSTLLQCSSIECGSTIFDDSRLPKILHGRDAVLGQLPWQIALYAGGYFACGGSIIHPHWVLTAAHCIDRTVSYSVTVGAVDVGMSSSVNYDNYNSSQIYVNPFYNNDFDNDISLVYINEPIVYNDYVRPICIASQGTVEEMLNAGYNAECYVSGWGRYHNLINGVTGAWLGKLQIVRVYLYNQEDCNQVYFDIYKSYPQNTTVCVDNQNVGSPTCNGDSGGPLICRNKYGRFEVLGTLSWGYISCFKDGYPDIYQLSYPHEDWIEATTGILFYINTSLNPCTNHFRNFDDQTPIVAPGKVHNGNEETGS